jgi:16S rRNA (guanine527-N7)-methyltransferase
VADALTQALADGLAAQGIECDQSTQQQLITFVHLLQKWNKVYNLTAIRDPQQSLIRHIFDSLSVLSYLKGPSILDVGAGAGLPGLPLALLSTDYTFVECDSVAKKTRFIQQVITELGLTNVSVVAQRVQTLWQGEQFRQFDTVISRAFSSIVDMIEKSGPLCRTGGRLLAMKGTYPEQELIHIPPPFSIASIDKLNVYGLDEERYLVVLQKG